MATLENLTKAEVQQYLQGRSLTKVYGNLRYVYEPVRAGSTLRADVGDRRLYHVEIDVLADGIHATCDCGYGGYCKHISALLLCWIEQRDVFTEEGAEPAGPDNIIETFAVEPPPATMPRRGPFWLETPHQARRQANDTQLRHILELQRVPELRILGKKLGHILKGTRKADLIDQLLIQLSQPGILLKSLLSLGAEHRQVLDALSILHPGIWYKDADVAAVAGHWGELNQYEDVDSYINDLHETGLVMFGDLDNRYWHRLPFLAGNASRLLPPLLTGRLPTLAPPVSVEKSDAAVRARAFLQRTLRILQMLEQYTPPLRTPMPRPRLEKHYPFLQEWDYLPDEIRAAQVANKIARHDALLRLTVPAPQPVLPDEYAQRLAPIAGGEMELEFIIHLLLTVGLILPGSPVTIWHDNRTQFLRLDENSQWSTLVHSYFSLNRWSELWLLLQQQPELQLERVIRPYHKPVEPAELNGTLRLMRLQLLQLLATLPDDAWYAPADVAALLQLIWPRFDSLSWTRPYYGQKDSQPDWYLAENGQPLDTRADMVAWQKAQGAFLAETICGPLHWLGLADVQLENGRLVAFQLHGLADLFLDKVPTFALPEANGQVAGPITRDDGPDDDILINELTIAVKPAAISAQAHSYLDDIAILETADPDRFVYRLDVTAVHQSLEAGRTLAEMLKQWEKWLSIPVPELIKQQLTAWSDLYGRVRLYEGMSVIEFGDEYALAEMKAATSLADYLVAEISPTLVIVPAAAIELLTAELEKAGYTPKSVAGV